MNVLSTLADLHIDPVFYCNDLGKEPGDDLNEVASSARSCTSIKEAVRFASNNNLMGLICSSRLLVCISKSLVCTGYSNAFF